MEKIGENQREEELKSHTAIRCAKAAVLLSSLKNVTNNSTTNSSLLQDEEEIEMLEIEMVKLRKKIKKLRQCMGVMFLSYVLIFLLVPLVIKSL